MVLDCLASLAQGSIGIAQVAQVSAFASSIPDLSADHQGLLIVLDG